MDSNIKIVLIEDHTLTRIGLKTALEESSVLELVGEADSGEQGVKIALELEPDVVLMDLGLPGINGIEATRLIKQSNPDIKVLILTSHDSENDVINSVEAGADAYCMKDINPSRLISIVEGVADGGVWFDKEAAKSILKHLEYENKSASAVQEASPLTARELEILQLLADGLNNADIAKQISVSQYTVKAHICNILQKLSVDDRTGAVAKAMRKGWVK